MTAPRFDLVSQEFKRDPLPTFARMRELGPLVHARLPLVGDVWLATTYASVKEILRDQATFVREPRNAGKTRMAGMRWWMPRTVLVLSKNMLGRDEPDHRRLRTLVEEAFLRASVEEMRPRIAALADQTLDDWERAAVGGGGSADFIRHFARPFPLAVICELLGLPAEDRPKFTRWAGRLTTATSLLGFAAALPGLRNVQNYLRQEFRKCRERPRPGLISALVSAEQAGDRLDEDELLAMAFLLLFAGHETTVHLISGGVHALLDHPDQKSKLTADWAKAGSAVDEVLRFVSSVQFTKPRYASRDLEFHGQMIRRGEVFMPLLAAANSDPERFELPEKFDIDRSPNPHLSFGAGIHVCLGMKLARAEVEIAFERIFTRFPALGRSVPSSDLEWTKRLGLRALRVLPLSPGPGQHASTLTDGAHAPKTNLPPRRSVC